MTPPPGVLRTLDELSRRYLIAGRASVLYRLNIATFVLAIGVVLEGAEEIKEFWDEILRHGFRSRFRLNAAGREPVEHPWKWIVVLGFIGWILVATGVYGEFKFQNEIADFDRVISAIDDELLVQIRFEAALMNERAEALRRDNLTLQGDVLKLRLKIADRHLTRQQQESLQRASLRFTSGFIQITLYNPDEEMVGLGIDIWRSLRPKASIGSRIRVAVVTGVVVIAHRNASLEEKQGARALAALLSGDGLKASFLDGELPVSSPIFVSPTGFEDALRKFTAEPTLKSSKVEIAVGKKP